MDPLRRVPPGRKFTQARELRRAATSTERYAWSLLRKRGILGLKFRRQHVLHGFIVDFFCAAERLVLELEGVPHAGSERRAYDAARAATLEAAGYRVIRVANRDVTRDQLAALLSRALEDRPRSPSPAGRGGQGVRTNARERQTGVRTNSREKGGQGMRTNAWRKRTGGLRTNGRRARKTKV